MNPIVEIGRYSIPLESVAMVQVRQASWWQILKTAITRRAPAPEYDVYLAGGIKMRFTEEEKLQLDEELATHHAVLEVMGMIGGMQANQRPR